MKKIIKWLDNFWYHNRWKVLIGGFFTVALIIMTIQLFNRDTQDVLILYTGPTIPTANQTLEICNSFENLMTEDHDGNEKKEVALHSMFLMTDEQLKDDKYKYDENGNPIFINTGEMATTRQQFSTQIFVGDAVICLLDPAWYDMVKKNDAFVPIAELTDKKFEDMYDESALYLHKTGFGKYFTSMKALPEDTLICFRRMSAASTLKNENTESKDYAFCKKFFVDIIEFEIN